MKNFLLSFDDFITGSGIWILVGCLGVLLLISVVFLILNIQKEKNKERQNAPIIYPQQNEPERAERIQPVEVKTSKSENDSIKEDKAKIEEESTEIKESQEPEKTKVSTKTTKKAPVKKTVADTEKTKIKKEKVETVSKVEEIPANYEVSYDFEAKEWVVKKSNSQRATKRTKTKQEAIDFAKPLAEKNNVNLIVHNKSDKN